MNTELWKQARGLTQKLKKQQSNSMSIGEKFIEWFIIGVFGLLILAFFILPVAIYFVWAHAYVLVKLWAWFVVPLFHLEPLTWAQAWGVTIVVTYLTHIHYTWKAKDERNTSEKVTEFFLVFLKPWSVLGVGWVCAHYFLHLF